MAGFWVALTIVLYISSVFSNSIKTHEETCPISQGFDIEDTHKVLLTVLSGHGNAPSSPDCQFHIYTPLNTNLFQLMTIGNLTFNYTTYSIGRMVECINNVCNRHPYYWMVFNATTQQLLPKGVDESYLEKDSDIVWKYIDTTSIPNGVNLYQVGNQDLTLPTDCEQSSSTLRRSYITVKLSAVNDRDPAWDPVCHLPVIAESGSTLGHVLYDASSQHPKKFQYTTEQDETHGRYVTSINSLVNEDEWNWLVYDPSTMELLMTGLDDTFPHNHEAFLWRYTNETHPSMTNCDQQSETLEAFLDVLFNGFNFLYSLLSWM